ncbi:hypothetical protein J6590_015904 [Homalodisca vitripennis]|nr:hypothetical protein J6590_015904 [Homalodisca vitripennis]
MEIEDDRSISKVYPNIDMVLFLLLQSKSLESGTSEWTERNNAVDKLPSDGEHATVVGGQDIATNTAFSPGFVSL